MPRREFTSKHRIGGRSIAEVSGPVRAAHSAISEARRLDWIGDARSERRKLPIEAYFSAVMLWFAEKPIAEQERILGPVLRRLEAILEGEAPAEEESPVTYTPGTPVMPPTARRKRSG